MSLDLKSLDELLKIASKTTLFEEMLFLTRHPVMNIRRALAKNDNINQNIIDVLISDPVQNVSYMAYKNSNNNNFDKKFEKNQRPCVICQKSEIELYCEKCDLIKDHLF